MEKNQDPNMIKLKSTNYTLWKDLMEDMSYNKDLYDPIYGGKGKPSDKFDVEWKKMDRKVVDLIRQWLNLSVYPQVKVEIDAQKMWNKLKELYEPKNMKNIACLIKKLVNMKYNDGDLMTEHMSVFQNIVNQLAFTNIKLDYELQALLLLSSLPDNWKVLVVTLTNLTSNGKLVMSTVKDIMLNEEVRRKECGLIVTPN